MNNILDIFNIKSEDDFKLKVLESLGNLVLMLHWQRGIIDALIRENVINLNPEQKSNWERVIKDCELYEEFTWEIAPSRAALLQLRQFRIKNNLEEGFELLFEKDPHGRIPYNLTSAQLDDIEDIIRRLKDARQATGFGHGVNL